MALDADVTTSVPQAGITENDGTSSKVHEKITIKVIKCMSLHNLRNTNLTTNVRVEFGSTVLGESPKYDYVPSEGWTLYNFECSMNIMIADPLAVDEIVQTPIVVTVQEILPKDKKTKEERVTVLGQACVDLLSLIKGQNHITTTYKLQNPAAVSDSPSKTENNVAEIEISLHLNKQLLLDDQLKSSNLVKICVESLYSLPDSWNQTAGLQNLNLLTLPMPVASQKDVSVIFPNGLYRSAGEKEPSNGRRWCVAPTASGSCLYMENSTIAPKCYEEEDGDLRSSQDELFRCEAENNKARVTWNSERRCILSRSAADSFMKSIARKRYWPVEVFRATISQGMKGKGKGEEEISASFHGIAYIDMAPLLYPGVKKIRGAYLVRPFSDTEQTERTGRKGTLMDDALKLVSSTRSSSSIAHSKLPTSKGNKFDGKPKPSAAVLKPPESIQENESHDWKRSEGQQYLDAKSYVVVEFQLDAPLVPKREPDVLEKRISELIPPRPKFMRKEEGEKRAIQSFRKQIKTSANHLLDEFRIMFLSQIGIKIDEEYKRAREFLYHVNASGKYFALKEQLKYFVVKVVREKFKITSPLKSRVELQTFLGELYEFLLDQMHLGLNRYFLTEETTEIPPAVTDVDMLKFFAWEAQVMFKYELAGNYYQERIALKGDQASFWVDYGCFCLLIGDHSKAEECFKESVAMNQKYLHGLIMNGCTSMMNNLHEEAEVYFEAATCCKPGSILAWTFLGIYYSVVENNIMAERAFTEAEKLMSSGTLSSRSVAIFAKNNVCDTDDKIRSALNEEMCSDEEQCSEVSKSTMLQTPRAAGCDKSYEKACSSIFLKAASYCVEHNVFQLAEKALSLELLSPGHGESAAYFQLLAELELLRKDYENAERSIKSCLQLEHDNADAWCLLGHIFFLNCNESDAKDAYLRALSYPTDAQDSHALYLRLGSMYLKEEEFSKARNIYLKACSKSPSCFSWLGVGISSYKLGELLEAEMALNEANVLDNHNHDVWAYLALVSVKQNRHLEAELCYKYAVKTGLQDAAMIDEMRATMEDNGFEMSLIL